MIYIKETKSKLDNICYQNDYKTLHYLQLFFREQSSLLLALKSRTFWQALTNCQKLDPLRFVKKKGFWVKQMAVKKNAFSSCSEKCVFTFFFCIFFQTDFMY